MFDTLKKELRIVEVLEYITEVPYKLIGTDTWAPEDGECPSCGHKDCFRIKDEGKNEESFAKCFSENITWDVTSIVATLKDISNTEAAKLLAKHYDIKFPTGYSPMQEIFNLAGNYYHDILLKAGPFAELNGLTPLEYQMQVRGHTLESIKEFKVGWSDGELIPYLESLGTDSDLIKDSGLQGKKGDYFGTKFFIYPHIVRGGVSHFTMKDVLKQKVFQIKNQYKLNGCTFYNQDSITKPGPVAICEGENDAISIVEGGWASGILCCNGSISGEQLDWLTINVRERDIVTFFDNDPAGIIYREKLEKISKHFKSLTQINVSGQCKDIDEYLKKGGNLSAIIESGIQKPVSVGYLESDTDPNVSPIIVKDGGYHKVVFKEGNESLRLLTNFTIELLNIYLRGLEREREIVIILANGKRSRPFIISSEAKTSIKSFKTLIANAIDASFYGNEFDLNMIWEKVYSMFPEREVNLIERVGWIEEFKGWLFQDCFISDTGTIYEPDDRGVMWITEKSGLKAVSIIYGEYNNTNQVGVPSIRSSLNEEERKKLIGDVIKALADNLGSLSEALSIVGWCWANVYCHIWAAEKHLFPQLQFFGLSGQGKSWIIKMLLDIFNMEAAAYTTVANLNSGVAFSRKMSYYVSLPMCIDEIRSDVVTMSWYDAFRSWYDRAGRTIGTKEGSGIRTFDVNSTLIFGGEDLFTDPATRARVIPIRLRKNGRDMISSFKVLESRRTEVNAIGYHWILSYGSISRRELLEEFNVIDKYLRSSGIDPRQTRNWAIVAIYANKLCREYFPEYNYMEHLVTEATYNQNEQAGDSTLTQFWDYVEGMQSAERPIITAEHLKRQDNLLYVWYNEIFRLFEKDTTYSTKQKFSKNAILAALKEEEYFVCADRKSIGMTKASRRCIVLDITKSPIPIQTIANFLDG